MTTVPRSLAEFIAKIDDMHDETPDTEFRLADTRDGLVYRYTDQLIIGTKVALITGRPLLIEGPAGCGKSSYAAYVARNLSFELLQYAVTDTSEPSDLLWEIDHVGRLNDAQANKLKDAADYVSKGVLWKAFEPDDRADRTGAGAVVLLDEVDKADAAFANSLLVPIGSNEFDVPPLGRSIRAANDRIVLVILTSNGERELPPALVRRCVSVMVTFPTADDLIDIVARRWPGWMSDEAFRAGVIKLARSLSQRDRAGSVSTAEFLDLVQVLRQGGIPPDGEAWAVVEQVVLASDRAGR